MKSLDLAFARVCYVQALPFNLYESESMISALHKLNPAYKPPTHKAIGGSLLSTTYDSMKLAVDKTVAALDYINVISDESNNINSS